MNKNNLSSGIFFIILGVFLVLKNMNVITWSILPAFFDLWPLILILIGINIIFNKNKIIIIVSLILFFLILLVYGYIQEQKYLQMNLVGNENIVLGKQIDTETANLDLKLKASDLNIKSTEDDLIKVYAPKQRLEYNVDFSDKKAFVSFFEKEELDIYNKIQQKDYDFYLNKDILWNIDAKIGVVNSTVDISNLKIKRLNIDSGAGNLKIILGDKNDISDINVKMGAGNVEIIIPDNLGVKIDTKGLIKDINFPNSDWEKIDNYYLSPNYKEFDKKVNLEIVMGAGNIKVYQR